MRLELPWNEAGNEARVALYETRMAWKRDRVALD